MHNIFYSWQSDLPNNSNRSFINDVLLAVIHELKNDGTIVISPVIDRDTQGLTGSPDIENSILSKIDSSFVFIADVSITNKDAQNSRPFPNPNVLIELGYAVKTLGLENIIMLQNAYFGGPELLPFDLRGKRVITYQVDPNSVDKSTEKKTLISKLKGALNPLIETLQDKIEVDTKLILLNHSASGILIERIMPMKLHSTWNMDLVYTFLLFKPEDMESNKSTQIKSCENYKILDVIRSKWINPQVAYELDKKTIAFVPKTLPWIDGITTEEEHAKVLSVLINMQLTHMNK